MSFTSALAIKRLRTILKFGATVFGLSAIFLLVDPKTFLELLNLNIPVILIYGMIVPYVLLHLVDAVGMGFANFIWKNF